MIQGRAATVVVTLLAASLLGLFTSLLVLSLDPAASRYDHALDVLDNFDMVESNLQRNILSARSGLLQNYDPMVHETGILANDVSALRAAGIGAGAVDPLAELVATQDKLVETFKTDNALEQNALAHFMLLAAQLDIAGKDEALAEPMTALLVKVLHLTRDTSPQLVAAVVSGLDDLAAREPTQAASDVLRALLVQGDELRVVLPETDGVVRSLWGLPSQRTERAARADVVARQEASRDAAGAYRFLLYLVSLLLLGLLIYLSVKLQRSMRAQHRRAVLEHRLTEISMRFVDAGPEKLGLLVERALASLAAWVGSDRAYFLASGPTPHRHVWAAAYADFPPGWPEKALAHAAGLASSDNGIVYVRNVDHMPDGSGKTDLMEAGLRGWVCVSVGSDEARSLLGFDTIHRPAAIEADELALLRMAFDAVTAATTRDAFQRERSRLEVTLQQVRRMDTIGAVASGIAHNFNNIIGAILGHTELLELQIPPEVQTSGNLEVIRQASERARDLVDQILAFGHRRDPERRPILIQTLMEETGALLASTMPVWVSLRIDEAPAAAIVSGEAAQLQQVVFNLCSNAAQAMDEEGVIRVKTAIRMVEKNRRFLQGSLPPGPYVCIAVCDTGRGMDQRTLEQIFEPFFTTRLDGNGLGLATVRAIVDEHGGAMNVVSAPGAGSTFEVWLPFAPAREDAPRAASSAGSRGHGETIMLIDDVTNQRLRNEDIVAALGYEPVGFARAEQAMAAFRLTPTRFDAVLISHLASTNMALELAGVLRYLAPRVPILFAASTDEINADMLTAAGIHEVVPRSFTSSELASALARSLPKVAASA